MEKVGEVEGLAPALQVLGDLEEHPVGEMVPSLLPDRFPGPGQEGDPFRRRFTTFSVGSCMERVTRLELATSCRIVFFSI